MHIEFTKMHGLGNDFVVIDNTTQTLNLTSQQIQFIADRHLGIGCDQVLLVEKAAMPEVDFAYRIFNADGNEVEQCGNGARCFARFVYEKGLSNKTILNVTTKSGLLRLRREEDGQVTVDMGPPRFAPGDIPFDVATEANSYSLNADGKAIEIGAVSMGNPHAVLIVDNVDDAPVGTLGPLLESHSRFPQRVNVGFMQINDRSNIRLRVFERGVGETLACGSGACAAMVVGHKRGLLDDQVNVALPGGVLQIAWQGGGESVMMTGPAGSVFDGRIDL